MSVIRGRVHVGHGRSMEAWRVYGAMEGPWYHGGSMGSWRVHMLQGGSMKVRLSLEVKEWSIMLTVFT